MIEKLNIPEINFYTWVDNVLRNKNNSILPPKISMKPSEVVFYNVMPAVLFEEQVAGVKIVNRYSDRKPTIESKILLYDLKTGENKAILDGNYITAIRTGAVAAHSIKLLANNNFDTIGMIGLGSTAQATFKILTALFPVKKLRVIILAYKDQHIKFMEKFQNLKYVNFQVYNEVEDLIKDSEVIVSAITYTNDLFAKDDCYREGCLVVPIHTRGFQNCDLFFDKVFADDEDHVKGFKYFSQFKAFHEVSDVICGRAFGRTDTKQRILVYNIGIAIHDIYFAEQIYNIINSSKREIKYE